MAILGILGAALLKGVLPILATTASGYLVAVLHKLLKKQGVELSKAKEAELEKTVEDALLQVEETARRNPNMTSQDKDAAGFRAVKAAAPDLTGYAIRSLVDRGLPLMRKKLADQVKSTEPKLSGY